MEIAIYTAVGTVIVMVVLDLIPHHKPRDKENRETKSVSILEHYCDVLAEKGIM